MTTITLSTTLTSRPVIGNMGGGGIPPVNTVLPLITGSSVVGSVLSCSTGTWTSALPITYSYQWRRGVSNISGATSSTYTLVQADTGQSVYCVVTATNTAGSSSATSSNSLTMLLLDGYPNAATAYSVRKLRTAYTGSCIRVRRSSDNAEQNIGFVNNLLDTASLLSFVGANNGFVTTWYDQSGNGNDVTQPTASFQPRIINAGVLDTQNSKPTIVFDGINDFLLRNNVNILNNKTQGAGYVAAKWNSNPVSTRKFLFYFATGGVGIGRYYVSGENTTLKYSFGVRRLDSDALSLLTSTNSLNTTTMFVQSNVIDYTNGDGFIYVNNNLEGSNLSFTTTGSTSASDSTQLTIGAQSSTAFISHSNISEVVFYENISNISNINTNIQTFFGI